MNIKISNKTNNRIILNFKDNIIGHNIVIDSKDYQLIPKYMFQNHLECCFNSREGIKNDYCFNIIMSLKLINKKDIADMLEKFNITS